MTIEEKLTQEFACAIKAVLGDYAEKDTNEYVVEIADINAIANKVKFYLDLN